MTTREKIRSILKNLKSILMFEKHKILMNRFQKVNDELSNKLKSKKTQHAVHMDS